MSEQVDRDANRALRARFDDVMSQYQRLRTGMDEMQERLAMMAVTAESPDGLVRATVGARGQLTKLDLDRDVYRQVGPEELSRIILRTVERASAKTTDRVQEMMSDILPADSAAMSFARNGEFSTLLARQDRVMRDEEDRHGR